LDGLREKEYIFYKISKINYFCCYDGIKLKVNSSSRIVEFCESWRAGKIKYAATVADKMVISG